MSPIKMEPLKKSPPKSLFLKVKLFSWPKTAAEGLCGAAERCGGEDRERGGGGGTGRSSHGVIF